MLADSAISQIADELRDAHTTRATVARLTARYPDMTVDDSYRVQQLWRRRSEEEGRVLAGRKIGLTSRAMQKSSGISEPDYGIVFDDMIHETGCEFRCDDFTFARVEVELAFVMKEDVAGPNASIFDVLRAAEYVVPALEILDSRVELEGRTIVDTIADNAAMGAMVIGGTPVTPDSVDLRRISGVLFRNHVVEETGVSAGILNHPANGVRWLVNKIHPFGDRVSAGEIVLAGSFTRPVEARPGDSFVADFGDLGLVTCNFV